MHCSSTCLDLCMSQQLPDRDFIISYVLRRFLGVLLPCTVHTLLSCCYLHPRTIHDILKVHYNEVSLLICD